MKLYKKILLVLTFVAAVNIFCTAYGQHNHGNDMNNDSLLTQIFFNESSFGKITVFSSLFPLTVNKNVDFRLLISMNDTLMKLNTTDTKLVVRKLDDRDINYLDFKASGEDNAMFGTSFKFVKAGNYKFQLKLFVMDPAGAKYLADFEFTQNVSGSGNKTSSSHHGFMGMSTEMWVIMGAAMITMMTVVLMTGVSHK